MRAKYALKRGSYAVQSFPLIRWFYYIGGGLTPWRCENCLTTEQKRGARLIGGCRDIPAPQCCAKCGVSYL